MTSAYLNRPLRTEAEARDNVVRLHPIVLPPHPTPTAWDVIEQHLRATVIELWSRKWLLLVLLALVGWLAFTIAADANRPPPATEFIEPTEFAQFGFRASFVELPDYPRFVEVRL